MKLPWSKRSRDVADQDVTGALLRELMEARHSNLTPAETLAEMIKIGNRDVGIDDPAEAVPAPAATPPTPVLAAPPAPRSESLTPPEEPVVVEVSPALDESLTGLTELSTEELVGLLEDPDPDLGRAV